MSEVSDREGQAAGPVEQACVLCLRAQADPDTCGHLVSSRGVSAHVFCMFFASGLHMYFVDGEQLGFRSCEVRRTAERAVRKDCFVCHRDGASVTCSEMGCQRSYHLPCAAEGKCVTQYLRQRRAFCSEHSPRQMLEAVPEEGTRCLICLEAVGDEQSFRTMVCPTCQHAWFHRHCVQIQVKC